MDTAAIIALMQQAGYTSFTPEDIKKFLESINNQIGDKKGAFGFSMGSNGTPNKASVEASLGALSGTSFGNDFSNAPKLPSDIAAATMAPLQAGLGIGGGADMTSLATTSAAANPSTIPGVDANIMKKLRRGMWNNAIQEGIGDPATIASQAGTFLTNAAIQGYPDVGVASVGAGLSGAVSGAKIGGLAGGILGAGFGATKGFIDSSNKRTSMDMMRKQEEEARLLGAGVSPTKMADGGIMDTLDSSGNIGVQTELGERVVLPNGDIVLVKADKLHKDMKGDVITDFLPQGSVVFSAKDKGRMMINPNNYKDQVIGYGVANYDENDPNPQSIREIRFGDIIGDKKISPSEALEKIRQKFSTVSNSKDIFTTATNEENKRARVPYIEMLAREQARKNGKPIMPAQQFAYGGGVHVRRMANGGNMNSPSMYMMQQPMVIPISMAPGYMPQVPQDISSMDWAQRGYLKSLDAINNPVMYAVGGMIRRADGSYSRRGLWDNIRANIGSGNEPTQEMLDQERKIRQMYAVGGGVGYNLDNADPTNPYAKALAQMQASGYFGSPAQAISGQSMADLSAQAGITDPSQLTLSSLNPQQQTAVAGPNGLQITPSQIVDIRTGATQGLAVPATATTQAAPQVYTQADIDKQKALIEDLRAKGDILNRYPEYQKKLDEMTAMNQAEFQRGQSALDIANRKRSGYIGAGNLNTMLTEGMQDPTVIGRFNTPYYMNERFANTPVSQLEGQISRVRANTNSIMAGLIDSGMSPSDAATLAQPMIEKTIDAESTARNTFLNNQLTTDKAKYEAMAKLRQDNDNELARVQQQFLINTNAIRKEMGQATGQWFKDQKDLIENKYKQQEELRKNYLTNEQTLGFKGLDLKSGLSTVYNNMQKAEQDRLDRMNEIVNKNLQADKTAAADAAKKAAKTAAAQTNAAATSVTTGAASTPAAPANTAQSIAAKYTALLSDPNINVNRGLRAAKNKYDQTEQIQFAANQVEPQIADIPDQFKDLARKYAIQDRWGEGANINSGIKENILKAISEIDPSITSPSIDKVQKYWQDNINKINSLMTNYPKTVEKAISGEFNREDFKVSPEKAIARNVLLQYGDKASRSNKNILGGSNNSKMQEGNLIDNIITPIKDLGIPDDYVPTATAYKYMTGRSIEDLMLYAANKVDQSIGIDKQKYDAPGAHLNEWKAQKVAVLKLMADKPTEFKNILDKILKNENVEPPAAATTTSPTTTPSAILSKKQ